MEERRITRLENICDNLPPQLTEIKVSQAQQLAKLDGLGVSMSTLQELAQVGVTVQIEYSKNAAVQEERWEQHNKVHNQLVEDLKEVVKVASENKINIVKILAWGSLGGAGGGGLLVLLLELFRGIT